MKANTMTLRGPGSSHTGALRAFPLGKRKVKMKKLVFLFSVFFLFLSCEILGTHRKEYIAPASYKSALKKYNVSVIKHPDINFPETDPGSVKIYEGFKPLDDKYFAIGAIGIYGNEEIGSDEAKRELKEKAAEIGGHALIMIDVNSKTWESAGGITGISIPRYFWWDRPYYIGTDYYFQQLPKITYTSHSIIYIIVRFDKRSEDEFLKSLKKKYPYSEPRKIMEMLIEKDEEGNHKYSKEDISLFIAIDRAKYLSADFIENYEKYNKIYPLADGEKVWKIMIGRNEANYYIQTGKNRYTLKYLMMINHRENLRIILRAISLIRFR